jgi:chromosome segregation ATPase
MSLEAVSGKD